MDLVDAHHHLWIPEKTDPDPGYVWLRDIGSMKPFGDPTSIQRDYEWPEFSTESKQHNVVASVYLQVDGAIGDPVTETAWVDSVFQHTGLPHAIVGFANLANDNAHDIIEQQMRYQRFKGVRQILSRLDDQPELCFAAKHLLRDAQWRDQFASLASLQLRFDLQLYPEQMAEAAEFLAQFPDVPIIVDHAGSPHDQTTQGLKLWQEGISLLAELPQVSMKLCGFGMFDSQWSAESIKPLIHNLLEQYGSERLLFASNFPVDKLMSDYDAVVDKVRQALSGVSDAELQGIFRDNAMRVYNL